MDLLGAPQDRHARIGGAAVGGHQQQADAGRVDELQAAQVDDDRAGVAGLDVAELLLQARCAGDVQLAEQLDDVRVAVPGAAPPMRA